jgi:hypothetical protein
MSFVPPIRSNPSRLSGAPSLRIILDQDSVRDAFSGIEKEVNAGAEALAIELSLRAARFLRGLELGAGHRFLAGLWTNTKPIRSGSSVTVEVYNAAEHLTFQNRSNAPNSRKTYPIDGKALLSILLNGARAHEIAARNPANPLQFPVVRGERQSRFAGTAALGSGIGVASFLNPNKPNDVIQVDAVQHPGIVGNRFLQAAKTRLESEVATAGDELASRVTARI